MRAKRPAPIIRRCLTWLLWLSLLPLAQVTVVAHTLAHARADVGRYGDAKQAPRAAHCDLCLIGAAVGSAAPLGDVAPPTLLALDDTVPPPVRSRVRAAVPTHPYRSRAPPPASY